MFKNILVPTDGSELSQETARQAVVFAKHIGARITAYHAKPNIAAAYFYGEDKKAASNSLEQIDEQIDKEVRKNLELHRVSLPRCRGAMRHPLDLEQ